MMPHYRFDPTQVATLAGFLESKTEPDFVANVHLDAATPQQIEHGKRLVLENGCASCHEINGIKKPENFAPELSRIGSKPISQLLFVEGVDHNLPSYVAAKVRNPRVFRAGVEDAAVQVHAAAGGCHHHRAAGADRPGGNPAAGDAHRRPFSNRNTSPRDMPGSSCMTCAASVVT